MNTDPIADMLNRIRTSQAVGRKTVRLSYSKFKYEIAKILERKGWVGEVEKGGKKVGKTLKIELKYEEGEPVITEIVRVSSPGQRIYLPASKIKKVRDGFGMSIISTSKGLKTNQEARQSRLGGEILIEIY